MSFVCVCWSFAPLSFAKCPGVGRVNSPGKANLALRARTARQGGLVGNAWAFRHPERFSRGKRSGMAFFWLLFFCYRKKSDSPAGRDPQSPIKSNQ